jgi:hypothetical protein
MRRWRVTGYLLSVLGIVASAILTAVAKSQTPIDPLSWGMVLGRLGISMSMVFVGMDTILFAQSIVECLEEGNRSLPSLLRGRGSDQPPLGNPVCAMRLVGCVVLLMGLLLFVVGSRDALAALGVVPDPLLP